MFSSWFRKPPPPPPTDLYGNPLQRGEPFNLSIWQKRQATLLYHWMSMEYLQGLKNRIDALIAGADANLELASEQGRDAVLTSGRWGMRDTSSNWSTHVRSSLEEFRQSTVRQLAMRSQESYRFTAASDCARLVAEHSSAWMTPGEETAFSQQMDSVVRYAYNIDMAARRGGNGFKDSSMARAWRDHRHLFSRLPSLVVHRDVEVETGSRPPRTGVYVPQDDPYGTLQFGWTGDERGALDACRTFNALGLKLLSMVGREELWVNEARMAECASLLYQRGEITSREGFHSGAEHDPDCAWVMLSSQSFTERPCKWYLVEIVPGQFDDDAPDEGAMLAARDSQFLRCEAGQPCPREGWWFTPAKQGSRRRFQIGEVMPEFESDYGATIWQWDHDQC